MKTNINSAEVDATKLVTTRRQGGTTSIFLNCEHVGDAFKNTKSNGYGLMINLAFCQPDGTPTARVGWKVSKHKSLRDALEVARKHLTSAPSEVQAE